MTQSIPVVDAPDEGCRCSATGNRMTVALWSGAGRMIGFTTAYSAGCRLGGIEHHCHAPHCVVVVPPAMFMCRRHWFMLPLKIRNAVWANYRPGQEERLVRPTEEYFRVTDIAKNYIAQREGNPLPHPNQPAVLA